MARRSTSPEPTSPDMVEVVESTESNPTKVTRTPVAMVLEGLHELQAAEASDEDLMIAPKRGRAKLVLDDEIQKNMIMGVQHSFDNNKPLVWCTAKLDSEREVIKRLRLAAQTLGLGVRIYGSRIADRDGSQQLRIAYQGTVKRKYGTSQK